MSRTINYMLSRFALDPYDKKLLGNLNDSWEHLLQTNSHFSIYSTLCDVIEGETEVEEKKRVQKEYHSDIAIAMCHYHDKPLLCTVSVLKPPYSYEVSDGSQIPIHSFVTYPNKVEWILNGTPLIGQQFTISFFDLETKKKVATSHRIYHAALNMDLRKEILRDSIHRCYFSNSSKYIQTSAFRVCQLIEDGSSGGSSELKMYCWYYLDNLHVEK